MSPAPRPAAIPGTAARLGAALAACLAAAAAWTLYGDPALGLMLGAMRFCG